MVPMQKFGFNLQVTPEELSLENNNNIRIMKTNILLLLLIIGFQSDVIISQENENKGNLFIIGGGSRPSSMVDRIITESGLNNGGYGIILPMSSAEPDSAVYYSRAQFYDKGIKNIYGLSFSKNEKLTASKL